MTIQDLRDGLDDLAASVTRGVVFEDVARLAQRSHRRRSTALAAIAVITVVGTGVVVQDHRNSPSKAQVAADSGPVPVLLDEMRVRPIKHLIGDQRKGVRLSTYPVGDDALILVGVKGNGYTCTLGYLASGARGLGTGGLCSKPNGSGAVDPADVIYAGWGVSEVPGHSYFAINASGPPGTTRFLLTASDGRTLTVPAYDAGPEWGHRSYFAVPWVSGTTVIKAYDDAGNQLACGTTGKGSRC
jgi:hypothetical protein